MRRFRLSRRRRVRRLPRVTRCRPPGDFTQMLVITQQLVSFLRALAPAIPALAPADPVGMGTLTPGRLVASAAALLALTGIVLGARALRSVARGADSARPAAAALVAGLF